ncbi:MAG: hypothetical protein KAW52_00440 [candidate division Zixibacteria bacterium]|nr:hypothetical protein [candidate division Zixibacteria bacterium]
MTGSRDIEGMFVFTVGRVVNALVTEYDDFYDHFCDHIWLESTDPKYWWCCKCGEYRRKQ